VTPPATVAGLFQLLARVMPVLNGTLALLILSSRSPTSTPGRLNCKGEGLVLVTVQLGGSKAPTETVVVSGAAASV